MKRGSLSGMFYYVFLLSFLIYWGCSSDSGSSDIGIDVLRTDNQPPLFEGLGSIKVDISQLSVLLEWNQATDNITPQERILYLICMSEIKGDCISSFKEKFSITGRTTYRIDGLLEGKEYFFVVRAKDEGGNVDTNAVERSVRMEKEKDKNPPMFMGLLYATPSSVSSVRLIWGPATDNTTATEKIKYSICISESERDCIDNFKESVKTEPGVVVYDIKGLETNKRYYFLVRSEDEEGNMDANKEERSAMPVDSSKFIRTYGDVSYRSASSFQMIEDGFILCGNGRVGDALDPDIVVSKLDMYGNVKWIKVIGGGRNDSCTAVSVSKDGYIFIAGVTQSFTQYGDKDIILIKIDQEGNLLFSKVLSSQLNDLNAQMDMLPDGSIVLTGYTETRDQKYDSFILVFDKDGNLLKNKFLHSDADDYVTRAKVNGEKIYLVGYTNPASLNNYDGFIVSLDKDLNILQQKTIGGDGFEQFTAINFDPHQNILLVGQTQTASFGDNLGDIFVVSLMSDFSGTNFISLYSGDKKESAGDIVPYKGGFAIVGDTVPPIGGDDDAFLIITNDQGDIKVKKYYRGIRDDWFSKALFDNDNIYILGGTASMHNETPEVWLLKLQEDGTTGGECTLSFINEWDVLKKSIQPVISDGGFVIQDSYMAVRDVVVNLSEVGAYVDSQCQSW